MLEKISEARAIALSSINTVIAFIAFVLAIVVLPIPGVDQIPANWVVILGGILTALRTLVAYLNPKDPSFGVNSDKKPEIPADEDPLAGSFADAPVDPDLAMTPEQIAEAEAQIDLTGEQG